MANPNPPLKMKRNIALLALCQAVFNTSTGVVLSVSALVGLALASNNSLATLPQALQWEATAALSIPLAFIMRRFGRKAGFVFGALMGSTGALVAAIAIFQGSFLLYLVAILFFGAYTISGHSFRFAAADVADDKWRSIAISLVVGGGIVAAFVGPEISKWTHDVAATWLGNESFARAVEFIGGPAIAVVTAEPGSRTPPYQFASTFLVLAFIPLLLIVVVSFVRFPPMVKQTFETSGRSLGTIARQPVFVVAVLCAVIGWGVMVLMMAATPLAMVKEYGYSYVDAALVVQWHMFGMYAPSFFTGWLIGKIGLLNVLIAGLILSSAAALIGLSGNSLAFFLAANICVGMGWNFLFVGSTALLTRSYRPEEKNKSQGLNDALVFQTVAAFSFSAGLLHNTIGWESICVVLLPFIVIVFVAVLYLKFKPGAAPAGLGRPGAALSEERIQETLYSLSVQKFFHLSQKVARVAGDQRDLLASDTDGGDCSAVAKEIAATLAEIDEIIGEQNFGSVTQVVASTRQALADIEACGDKVTARHFDLLHAHGGSIGVVLKESDESAGALVSALERAVIVVKGGEGAAEAELEAGSGEPTTAPPEAAPQPAPEESPAPDRPAVEASEPRGKIPFKVRFKAWWNGVEPADMPAGTPK